MPKLYKLYLTGDEVDEINKLFDIIHKHRNNVNKRANDVRSDRDNVKTRAKKPIKALVFVGDNKVEYIDVIIENNIYK